MLLHAVNRGEHAPAEELQPGRQRRLDSFMRDELKHFTTHRICRLGESGVIVAETARTWCPDLIMMPTHGLGLYDRLILGSVTARTLRGLDRPLWTDVHSEFARAARKDRLPSNPMRGEFERPKPEHTAMGILLCQ